MRLSLFAISVMKNPLPLDHLSWRQLQGEDFLRHLHQGPTKAVVKIDFNIGWFGIFQIIREIMILKIDFKQ